MLKKIAILMIACLILFACSKTTKPQAQVATPYFNPIAGAYSQNQVVEIHCATTGAIIHYTLDETEPTASSPVYNTGIGITLATTIKARAFKSNMKASAIASAAYEFNVASLQIYPGTGTYTTPQTVEITHIIQGTITHYTIDGTDPTEASPTYTVPLLISGNTTLKAKGYIVGWNPTQIVTATYNMLVQPVTFSPEGGTFATPQTVSLAGVTPNTIIHYTTDGTEPTEASPIYSEPLVIAGKTILKAKGFINGWTSSTTTSQTYSFNTTLPSFSVTEGIYYNTFDVTLSTPTAAATIRYTTDGSDPTESSAIYTGPLPVTANETIKARTYKANWNTSPIASVAYVLKVVAPTFSPLPDTYTTAQTITISTTTPNVTIYYTTDGSDPSTGSTQYTNPVVIESSTTLKAKAYKTGWSGSNISSGPYTINAVQTVATPTFNPPGGSYNSIQSVVIATTTGSATVRYTTDGSEPTASSTAYTTPVTVGVTTTLKAKAFRTGFNPSATASEVYNINFTSTQMILIPAGTFTMGRSSGTGNTDELPPHSVTLNSYYIGKYEVIQSDWTSIMGSNPSYFTEDGFQPVENVSWYAALVYCNKRSINESLTPVYTIGGATNPDNWGTIPNTLSLTWDAVTMDTNANGYRLPTEAEWEYAARGATNTPDYIFAGSNTLSDVGWYQANAGGTPHPVGELAGNGISTFDMSGNVNEWCWDWYSNSYYSVSPANNPAGPATGNWRMLKGGSWSDFVSTPSRVVNRNAIVPYNVVNTNGLRVVRKAN